MTEGPYTLPPSDPPPQAPSPQEDSYSADKKRPLRERAIRSSFWTLGAQGLSQLMRLGSNLLLTRLLFPEAFGLMALVQVVIRGVEMFSDVGLRGSIISNKRGDDPTFLNTAWTLQILRGTTLWIVICLLAIPAATFYEKPELALLLPVVGATSLIRGFGSTARHSLTRNVLLARLVRLDLVAQLLGIVVMISLALVWKSVWALVLGGTFGAIFRAAWSHRLIPGYSNRFAFDREAALSMFRFGRWIFVSVSMAFLLDQGDKLVLGKLLTAGELGVYSIALVFTRSVSRVISKLSFSVLQPVFAKLLEQKRAVFRRKLWRIRATILVCALPPLWVLCVFGEPIIGFLYDERYADAGWMMRIVAVGAMASVVGVSTDRVFLARGDSFRWMILQLSRAALMTTGIFVGISLAGVSGLLMGVAAASISSYVPLAIMLRKYDVWLPLLDFLAFATSAAVVVTGFLLM